MTNSHFIRVRIQQFSIGTCPGPTANDAARRDVMIRRLPCGDLRAVSLSNAK